MTNGSDKESVLGIDVGSVAVSLAEVDPAGRVIGTAYEFHHGDPAGRLRAMLKDLDHSQWLGVAATRSTPDTVLADGRYDDQVAVISAALRMHGDLRTILYVGGEKFSAMFFDEDGGYLRSRTNTLCAAGTGSFLEQQARRLNLEGVAELGELAYYNQGGLPRIASRCSVFAKTDLVHAQQEGYSLEEVCDGLCRGLARNVTDTVFVYGPPAAPILFAGGVSKNRAVIKHIQTILGREVRVDPLPVHGALGAALLLLDEPGRLGRREIRTPGDLYHEREKPRTYHHHPLRLVESRYPDFSSGERYEYERANAPLPYPVEVDVYEPLTPGTTHGVYLGIDIGSTSTKAVLTLRGDRVWAGFYTRTAGRPVAAVQSVFAAVQDLADRCGVNLEVIGAGTTGSGRKLAGRIIGADLIIDEITAHARAAWELDPRVDTIIEIGGQDSKFTTLKNGVVTFSVMNHVCAAGTGSFIEELAQRLGCPLSDLSARTEDRRSPIASDRCTVFMERDVNHYLKDGYDVDEVLASVLHSIRENYLTKVAVENSIGDRVCFQGATAKIKSLVAAFEQRLGKPIFVSEYCHLTGALGTALLLAERESRVSAFRGIDLHKTRIPIRSEVCDLCTNHCKITVAEVGEESVAYGFLCGRDYQTRKRVDNNRSGFDLLKARKRVFRFQERSGAGRDVSVGLPAALYMVEDLPMWRTFFDYLGVKTVTSEGCDDALKQGKQLCGSELCAPMMAMHGHVQYLFDRCDNIFFPTYLEDRTGSRDVRRQYCYYTQYAPSLAKGMAGPEMNGRIISPLVRYLYHDFVSRVRLYRELRAAPLPDVGFREVSEAYDQAMKTHQAAREELKALYRGTDFQEDEIHAVLLGRPYTILSASMNKGIPNIFGALGVKAFFQDMLTYSQDDTTPIEPLLEEIHWRYSARILEAAEVIAKTPGAYPVFITSFKCTPDAFTTEYFKKVMDAHKKPYLILQLDEHDSSVGYETRIEAAIRSFRNHHAGSREDRSAGPITILKPVTEKHVSDKTIFLPNWEPMSLSLIAANLQRAGLDARVLQPGETSSQEGLRHNTGQCIPLNIIAQEFIDNVEASGLDPADTVLWMVRSQLSCNLSLFPYHIKTILDAHGRGMEKAGVYVGDLSFMDISMRLPLNTYFCFMFAGMIRRMGCEIRPYEIVKGTTDRVIEKSMAVMTEAFLGRRSKESAVARVVSWFEGIETRPGKRPKVAIFGDGYVRDNEIMNQNLIAVIEEHGGEVVTTPYNEYLKMIARAYLRKWFIEGKYLDVLSSEALLLTVTQMEKTYYKYFNRVLKNHADDEHVSAKRVLSEHHVLVEHTGESMENLLKIHHLLRMHPDLSLFVLAGPAFCCPSLVTEAMAGEIERKTGVPIVSITYDGTAVGKNDAVAPFLKFPRRRNEGEIIRGTSGA